MQHNPALAFQAVMCPVKLNCPLINVDPITCLTEQHQNCQLGYKICVTLCPLSGKSALAHQVPLASVAAGSFHQSQASGHGNVLKLTASGHMLPPGNV